MTRPPTSPPRQFATRFLAARLLAISGILVAFALRLHKLGAESLWYDETVSVFLARQSIAELIAHTARDIHPPGYYLLLHAWGWLTQPTLENGLEFLYAWPSLFWGVLLLPLVFILGRHLFTHRVAVIALWLTAVNPYHIWYSQEVRMYTLGAGLGLLCLWAALNWQKIPSVDDTSNHKSQFTIHYSLFLYSLSAAVGLYVLYYFAFLLIALNILILWRILVNHPIYPRPITRLLVQWIIANVAAFLLWLLWLPVFWRQMTDPPVPPWRGALDLTSVMQESLTALLVGQSPPLGIRWLWALAASILLVAVFAGMWRQRARANDGEPTPDREAWSLAIFIFLPLLLIVVISQTFTPLYHIRYFFTYAAASTLLIAVAIEKLAARRRWLHAIYLAGIVVVSGWSLSEFWENPLYRADDHRTAVSALAEAWRPGDVVLVNAGWAYTALDVYWPAAPSPFGRQSASAPIRTRLHDYTKSTPSVPDEEAPLVLLGGSVDGSGNLGWGLAESDFYAISTDETEAALAQVAARHGRIWHYRVYDTVSDPNAVVRAWLDTHATQRLDLLYPGRDYLRVQLFETSALDEPVNCPQTPQVVVKFGDGLTLRGVDYSPTPKAGSTLYATLCWEIGENVSVENLRTSLRLYRLTGEEAVLAVQKDEAPFLSTATRSARQTALALPIPAQTPPGSYRLELIVYDGTTGDPLPIDDQRAIVGQRWPLAETIDIKPDIKSKKD